MGMLKDIICELKLTPEQIQDPEIQDFVRAVAKRKVSGKYYQYWNGNGYCELNKEDGTLITTIISDETFKAEFPLNCDMNISNNCCIGCEFCYQGCTVDGKHSDIKKFIDDKNSFLYSLHPGTELAINGNEPFHPDLALLLEFCKEHDILANLTVNEVSLLKNKEQLEQWLDAGLIHGIGVSPKTYSQEMLEWVSEHPTAVIHTIAGITTLANYRSMYDKNVKVLILGYKDFGRGVTYTNKFSDEILLNINDLRLDLPIMLREFVVLSFDNLAIDQLDVKSMLTEEQWNTFYRGDDGSHTLFIDLVSETFAKNSIQDKSKHKPLMSDIRDMLKEVQNA